jgi:hypothetical protein
MSRSARGVAQRTLLATALVAASLRAGATDPPGSLVGAWRLDAERSEDPHARLDALLARLTPTEARDRPGTAPGAGGGERGSGGGRGGSRGGSGAGGATAATASAEQAIEISEFIEAPQQIRISETSGDYSLEVAAGRTLHIRADGRWIRQEDRRETRAQWRDGALVVECRSETGPRSRVTYRVLPETGQLDVSRRLELPYAGGVTVRRVYDAAKGEETQPASPPAEPPARKPVRG